eukprot:scaffold10143_cov120-Isochrysis_galbana.AAC.5
MSRRQCHRSSALCRSCVRRPSQQDSVNVTSPVGREEGHGGAVAPCDEQPVDVERVDDEVGVELHDLVDVDQGENERFLGATRTHQVHIQEDAVTGWAPARRGRGSEPSPSTARGERRCAPILKIASDRDGRRLGRVAATGEGGMGWRVDLRFKPKNGRMRAETRRDDGA